MRTFCGKKCMCYLLLFLLRPSSSSFIRSIWTIPSIQCPCLSVLVVIFYSWLRQENRNSAGVPNEKPYRRLDIMWSSPWLKYLHIRPPIALNVFMRPLRHDMGTLNIPFRPLALKEFPLISSLSSSFRLTLLSPFESSYPSWHSHPIRQNRTHPIGTLILRKRFWMQSGVPYSLEALSLSTIANGGLGGCESCTNAQLYIN